jgi:hypothetical protein
VCFETYLVFVGGVEWNLNHLLVLGTVRVHVSNGQLHTLEEGGLGSITVTFPAQSHAILS